MSLFGLVLIVAAIGGVVALINSSQNNSQQAQIEGVKLEDAQADARRWVERLSHQVLTISGEDKASTQAMADASERYNAANSALTQATTVKQAQLARESALEGLHYVNAAREIMGMAPGPALPELEAQREAGKVTERRTIEHEGQTLTASPHAGEDTPHYYPGGAVAGRPVPAGWYSTAWWAPAAMTGMWAASSMMFYSAMFAGMAGTPSADQFAAGDFGGEGDAGADAADMGGAEGFGDAGDFGDAGGDFGGFGDFGDGGGFDFDFF